MKIKILLLFFIISITVSKAQKNSMWFFVKSNDTAITKNAFKLVRGNSSKQVFVNHDLAVHYQTRGSRNQDSLRYRVRGLYTNIQNDSMTIRSEEVSVHDAYKWNNDSAYHYLTNTKTSFIRVPMQKISKIYYERAELKKVSAAITVLSLAAAFIVAPLFALEDGEMDLKKFRKVAYPSLGVTAVSISVGLIFSQRKFVIRKPRNKEPVWMITPGG
jgi:hypothetical protein